MRYVLTACALVATLFLLSGSIGWHIAASGAAASIGAASIAPDPFGVDHISAVNEQTPTYGPLRYQQAREAGAKWNRWVFYWHEIETADGGSSYAVQDAVVNQDVANGFGYKIDAVLMGTPGWASTAEATTASITGPPPRVGRRSYGAAYDHEPAATAYSAPSSVTYPPRNLEQSVFADGTDVPGVGKGINQGNYWARFVYNTVSRFKDRVKHWEIWNEPDYYPNSASGWYGFWSGTADQYFRLLKVAYLAAKAADPGAVVLIGGMSYWPEIVQQNRPPLTFFRQVLALASSDPLGASNSRFFDVSPWHWYNRSSQSYYKMRDVAAALASYGLGDKPLWINETGMPAWNDPAKPPAGGNQPYFGSGTMTEQASFVLQSMAYALAAGVERSLVFQEYDDGNGEAFGLMRNDGTPRPAYGAFQLGARYLTGTYSAGLAEQGAVSVVKAFTTSGNRVVALWNNSSTATQAAVPARTGSATLLWQPTEANPWGTQQTIYPTEGQYVVGLPGATNNNGVSPADYIVGGLVALVVESGVGGPDPTTTPTAGPVLTGLIVNGRFDQGFASWTLGGYLPPAIVQSGAANYAALGESFQAQPGLGGANSTLSQTVALPARAPALTLKFRYLLSTSQPAPDNVYDPYSYDKLEMLVVDGAGARHTLLTDWTGKTSWLGSALDLTPYAGQTVTLVFNVWQSAGTTGYPTKAYLDDISLWPYTVPVLDMKRKS